MRTVTLSTIKARVLILTLISLLPLNASSALAVIPESILKNRRSVVTIFIKQEDKVMTSGSGFVISGKGIIVTNYHVIEEMQKSPANKLSIKASDGSYLTPQTFSTIDKDKDLALIQVLEDDLQPVVLAQRGKEAQGDDVVVIGSPMGLETTVSNGIISSIRGNDGHFQITAPISPGSSGSPVFNQYGEVIGVATYSFAGGQNLNFAVPTRYIRSMLADATRLASRVSVNGLQPDLSAEDFYRNAQYLVSQELYSDALVAVTQAISRDGSNSEYYDLRISLLLDAKEFDAAVKDCEKAITLTSQNDIFYAYKGFALIEMERPNEAMACLNAAIAKNKANAAYFGMRGWLYLYLEYFEKSLADFTRAIALAPSEGGYLMRRGIVQQKLKRYRKALADYDLALEALEDGHPDRQDCVRFRGDLKFEMGDIESAQEDYDYLCREGNNYGCHLAKEVQKQLNRGTNWVFYAESSGNKTFFYNKEGIKHRGVYVTAWQRQENSEDGTYIVTQNVINCKTRQIGWSQYLAYGTDGSVVNFDSNKHVVFSDVVPDTIGDEFARLMCGKW